MNDRIQIHQAFILRSVDYRESDRIVTLLTREYGTISALARGARKSQRRFGGALEPFAKIEVTVQSRRSGLWSLSEARLLSSNRRLSDDFSKMGGASFVLELVREILPAHDPSPDVFDLVEKTLSILCGADSTSVLSIVMAAQLEVLAMTGMGLVLDKCSACGRQVPPGKKVKYNPARGGVVCTECGGGPILLSSEAIAALQQLGSCQVTGAAEVFVGPAEIPALEEALTGFLEYHLDRQLRTKTFFFQSIRGNGLAGPSGETAI